MIDEKTKIKKLLDLQTPSEVFAEVQKIVRLMFPALDFGPVCKAFADILRLFAGKYPGYRKCNTHYHDLNHTVNCLLVMTRLIHGGYLRGISWHEKDLSLGLISALMHDTGYIQTIKDNAGTGAKYTLIHIDRSIKFMETYFKMNGYSHEDFLACRNFLRCTGLDVQVAKIKFKNQNYEIIGKILGAADLIGQMSDKYYLEKLPSLYYEFAEGGVPGYKDELDLFKKTFDFWKVVKKRLGNDLGNVNEYLRDHFREYCGIDKDLYHEAIEHNLECLQSILRSSATTYAAYLEQAHICWI